MVKWLKRKEGTGQGVVTDGTGSYEIPDHNHPYGTGMPDALADRLLKTGQYIEMNGEWHEKLRKQKDQSIINDALSKIPEAARKYFSVVNLDEKSQKNVKGDK